MDASASRYPPDLVLQGGIRPFPAFTHPLANRRSPKSRRRRDPPPGARVQAATTASSAQHPARPNPSSSSGFTRPCGIVFATVPFFGRFVYASSS